MRKLSKALRTTALYALGYLAIAGVMTAVLWFVAGVIDPLSPKPQNHWTDILLLPLPYIYVGVAVGIVVLTLYGIGVVFSYVWSRRRINPTQTDLNG